MSDNRRYTGRWLGGMLILLSLLLQTACSGSSDEDLPEKARLKIYIFAPDRPTVTRADNGDVNASDKEKEIKSLHVWVFVHKEKTDPNYYNGGDYIGHISLSNVMLSETSASEVTMELDDAFANQETKPNVDVYVAANVTASNCGVSFSASTTRKQLEDALIAQNYFGVSSLVKTVPADGLPMTGVMRNKKITGQRPTYQVSEESGGLANVRLVRAVSKIRFVFSKSTSNPDEVAVNSVKLNAGVMPTSEYLFLDNAYDLVTDKWKVGEQFEPEMTLVSSVNGEDIKMNDSPASYSWDGVMTGHEYESRIQTGIDQGKLTDLGTFYLRESNQILSGTITYTLKHTDEQKAGTADATVASPAFSMKTAGDFSRNHTWIVYAYFVSSGDLIMGIVEIKDWGNSEPTSQSVYNW